MQRVQGRAIVHHVIVHGEGIARLIAWRSLIREEHLHWQVRPLPNRTPSERNQTVNLKPTTCKFAVRSECCGWVRMTCLLPSQRAGATYVNVQALAAAHLPQKETVVRCHPTCRQDDTETPNTRKRRRETRSIQAHKAELIRLPTIRAAFSITC